jgi:hypothetical protein
LFTADFQDRTPTSVLDKQEHIIAVLAGWPANGSWDSITQDISQNIEAAHLECKFSKNAEKHRQGNYWALSIGISYGGGQTVSNDIY